MPRQVFVTRPQFRRSDRALSSVIKMFFVQLAIVPMLGLGLGVFFLLKWLEAPVFFQICLLVIGVASPIPLVLIAVKFRLEKRAEALSNSVTQQKIVIGDEGVWVLGPTGAVNCSFADLTGVEVGKGALLLQRNRGCTLKVQVEGPYQVKEAVDEAARQFTRREPARSIPALLREGRPLQEWIADLRSLTYADRQGYRSAHLSPDSLVAVVEDPKSIPEARVAAALALSDLPALHPRVRVAIGSVADPHLARNLERAIAGQLKEVER